MITLSGIYIQYGGRVVLNNLSLTFGLQERVGLVGRNGAGKSTLMKVISGEMSNFDGSVSRPAGVTIGYLHQDMFIPKGKTVVDEAMTAFGEVKDIEKKLVELHHLMDTRTDYESDAYLKILEDFADADERFRQLGGMTMQADAEKILSGLGFKQTDFTRLTDEFSGGWQMRIELAKMLLSRPNYLLLDEPTNHLDIESIIWLEEFLQPYEGTVIVISHDRTFLDNVTKRTVEIELGKPYDYKANYSRYTELREERREQMENAYANQQQKIAQTERLIDKFRVKANKAKFAQSLIKQLDRMERVELDGEDNSAMRLIFPPAPRSGEVCIKMDGLSKSYGDNLILDKIDFQLDRGERVSFVGKNGEGKTTLSKIIVGSEQATGGSFVLGHNVQIGYYAQNQADALSPQLTVLETLDRVAPFEMRPKLRSILGSFLFSGEDVDKKVSVLSGGERARLAMACLLMKPINLLILDEPTNHLDMVSKDILKMALLEYDGAMIVVSHDRDFLSELTERTVEFSNKKLHNHLGDMQFFLEKRQFRDLREVSLGKASENAANAAANAANASSSVAKAEIDPQEQKRVQKLIQTIEKRIADLEDKLKKIEVILGEHENFDTPNYKKALEDHSKFKKELEEEMKKWEEAISNAE